MAEGKSYKVLSGAALKWIALVSMVLDHSGYLLQKLAMSGVLEKTHELSILIFVMRSLTNCFPIFVFLLFEGFHHTSNRKRYGIRLALFALISELPYYLFFNAGGAAGSYRANIGFTFLLLFFLMIGYSRLPNEGGAKKWLGFALLTVAAAAIARFGPIQYSYTGVVLIALFTLLRNPFISSPLGFALIGIRGKIQIGYLLPFILLLFYNGKRGKAGPKYFFYIFYPAHILVLWIIFVLLTA